MANPDCSDPAGRALPGSTFPGSSAEDLPARTFGWSDVFVHPDEDPREGGPDAAGERAILIQYLRDRRLTLELKCSGLDAEQLSRRSVPPSNLSLLGLLRHLADVERFWFRRVMAGEDVPRLFRTSTEPGADFDGAVPDPDVAARAWQAWRTEVAFAEQLVAGAADLDIEGTFDWEGQCGVISLRQVLVHMIEEYARHNGHADFLRERIDGRVGQ